MLRWQHVIERMVTALALLCLVGEAYAADHEFAREPMAASESLAPSRVSRYLDLRSDVDQATLTALGSVFERASPHDVLPRRGAREAELYRKTSRGVVLVIAGERSLGSGSVISSDGLVLTNWHVVQRKKAVVVVFKPPRGSEVREQDAYIGVVTKIDEVADLALVKLMTPPPNITVLKLGSMNQVEVGVDVHAIGHPTGEAWSYTRGIVSQLHPNYEWRTEKEFMHKASVIQTQTPINPGNSGGPLLSDAREIIGVNSFKKRGESLNFAVSVEEIHRFLQRKGDRYAARKLARKSSCKTRYDKKDTNKNGINDLVRADTNCDGRPDKLYFDENEDGKIDFALIDSDYDGTFETKAVDTNKDGKADLWLVDTDGDGKFDIAGIDSDGDGTIDRYKRLGG